MSKSGAVLDSTGSAISTSVNDQAAPALAFDGTNYLAVWTDSRRADPDDFFGGDPDIFGVRVRKSGVPFSASGFLTSTAANSQRNPAVGFDGTNYLVVWSDHRGSRNTIYGARLSKSGTILDGGGFAISDASGPAFDPALAFDGTNYLVTWTDARSGPFAEAIYGARVAKSGTVLDPTSFAVSGAGFRDASAVAFDGTNYLVTWTAYNFDGGDFPSDSDIYGARVTKAGTVLDPNGFAISTAANFQTSSAVAFDGANYLVVWADARSGADVYGARVTEAGAVLEPNGIAISTGAAGAYTPSVAFDSANFTSYLVVWSDDRNGNDDIYAARVTGSGAVLDPAGFPVSSVPEGQNRPQVAFNTSFMVVWNDRRSGTNTDVYGNRVNTAGGVLDGDGFAVARSATDEGPPSLVADTTRANGFGIVYDRFVPQSPYGSNRVFLRTSPK